MACKASRWLLIGGLVAGCSGSEPADGPSLPETPAEHQLGETVYQANCAICHDTSRDGAPRLGYLAAWKRRLKQGEETLVQNALEGVDLMPPRGDNPELTDDEVAGAVRYLIYRAELNIPAGH